MHQKTQLTPAQEAALRRYFLALVREILPITARQGIRSGQEFPGDTSEYFGRLLLDIAAGPDWAAKYEIPIYRNLPLPVVCRAVGIGRIIAREGNTACLEFDRRRRAAQTPPSPPA